MNLSFESLKSRYVSKGYSTANDVLGAATKGQNALCAQYKKHFCARQKLT
ncbi:hypothetical protein AB6F62_16600 [Providencia huaxiensis]